MLNEISRPPSSVASQMIDRILKGMLILSNVMVRMICIALTNVQKLGLMDKESPPRAKSV